MLEEARCLENVIIEKLGKQSQFKINNIRIKIIFYDNCYKSKIEYVKKCLCISFLYILNDIKQR